MRKKWRDKIASIESENNRRYSELRGDIFYCMKEKNFIECEECGCLIKKEEKNKLPSTVEQEDINEYRPTYSMAHITHPYLIAGYNYPVQTGSELIKTGTREVIKEHYRCKSCRDIGPLGPPAETTASPSPGEGDDY